MRPIHLLLFILAGIVSSFEAYAVSPPKVVLITGSFRGLGLKIAEDLLEKGHFVALSGRNLEDAPEWIKSGRMGNHAMAVQLDLADPSSMEKALKDIVTKWGRIDSLVHNANVTIMEPAFKISEKDLNVALKTNFMGPVNLTQMALPYFQRQKFGRIIYLSSAATLLNESNLAAYNATKSAAESYFFTLEGDIKSSPEFQGADVDVRVVRLAFVRSDYEPVVKLDQLPPDQKGFTRLMAFMRHHSPTTDESVSSVILKTLADPEASRLINLGIDGKLMLMASYLPKVVRHSCENLLIKIAGPPNPATEP